MSGQTGKPRAPITWPRASTESTRKRLQRERLRQLAPAQAGEQRGGRDAEAEEERVGRLQPAGRPGRERPGERDEGQQPRRGRAAPARRASARGCRGPGRRGAGSAMRGGRRPRAIIAAPCPRGWPAAALLRRRLQGAQVLDDRADLLLRPSRRRSRSRRSGTRRPRSACRARRGRGAACGRPRCGGPSRPGTRRRCASRSALRSGG